MKTIHDWWGNPALDFGSNQELMEKYSDKIYVTVTNIPFGNCYVLFICDPAERNQAEEYLAQYRVLMESKGIRAYGAGISMGERLLAERMDGFQGGAQ